MLSNRSSTLLDVLPDAILSPAIAFKGRQLARRRFGVGFAEEFNRVKQHSRASMSSIQQAQLKRLQELLSLAATSSPYYEGLDDLVKLQRKGISALEDLSSIPLLDRDMVSALGDDLLTRKPSHSDVQHRTSGSTGQRLSFWLPFALRYPINAAHLYAFYEWFQFTLGDARVTIGGRYLGRRSGGRIVRNPAEKQLVLSSHSLSEESVDRYIDAIRSFVPATLQGHPTAIEELVRLAAESGRSLPRVPLVFTTGETLEDRTRKRIAEGLDCDHVASMYGSGENVIMASECPEGGGFHVDESFGYVELIPHESGLKEIVASSLMNDLMPFLRYRTGDLAGGWIDEPCPCGRTWRRLDKIVGRADDVIVLASGRRVLPLEIRTMVAREVPSAPPFMVRVYPKSGQYEIVLFDGGQGELSVEEVIVSIVRSLVGEGARIELVHTPASALLGIAGKHRVVEIMDEDEAQLR